MILALAVARLSRLIAADTFPPIRKVREAILSRWPNEDTEFGDSEIQTTAQNTLGFYVGELNNGTEVFKSGTSWRAVSPYAWSELITCVWCNSLWLAIAVWASHYFYDVTVIFAAPFAISYIVGFLDRDE